MSIKNETELTVVSKRTVVDSEYCLDLENTRILDTKINYRRGLFLEMVHINGSHNAINLRINHFQSCICLYFKIVLYPLKKN